MAGIAAGTAVTAVSKVIGSAIVGEAINVGVSKTFSNALELFQEVDTNRKLIILLTNDTKEEWTEAQVYTVAGTSNGIPPKIIKQSDGATYTLRRSKTPMILGGGQIRGILTYKINKKGDILVTYIFRNSYFQSFYNEKPMEHSDI